MIKPVDTAAQCLIDDGEGNLFVCPLYKREEAVAYFEETYRKLADDDYLPQPLPSYLQQISGLDRFSFFGGRSE